GRSLGRPALGGVGEAARRIVLEHEERRLLPYAADPADLLAGVEVDRLEGVLPFGPALEIAHERVDQLLRLRDLDGIPDFHSSTSTPAPRSVAARSTSAAAAASMTPTPTDL